MQKIRSSLDLVNAAVIVVTFILFTKGFTHDLFLELGVFLVSVKLIIATYQNKVISSEILQKLQRLEALAVNEKEK